MTELFANISAQSLALAVLTLSAMLLLVLVAMAYMYKHVSNKYEEHEETINMLQQDLSALCSGSVGVGDHLAKLDNLVRTIHKRQDHLEMHESPEYSYKHAIRLAKKGADIEEVVADCGIARSEAELIILANRMERAS